MSEPTMSEQTLNAIAAVLVEIRDHLATIANNTQAQTPSDTIKIIQAECITRGVDDNGKTMFKVSGFPYHIHGVRIWPEVLPRIGVQEANLVNGPNPFTQPVQVLMVNGSPKKVIGLASASNGEPQKASADGEPYYEPPDAPPPPPDEEIPF